MSTLRRDITTLFDYLSRQPATVQTESHVPLAGDSEYKLLIFPAPPNESSSPSSRLNNLSTLLSFLNGHLLASLPSNAGLQRSLCKPLTAALLDKLLIPSLPSSIEGLPAFLEVTRQAVQFEGEYMGHVLGDSSRDKEVEVWAKAVAGHYERKRRVDLLERARKITVREEDDSSAFRVEVVTPQDLIKKQEPTDERAVSPEEAAWGFEDEINEDAGAGEADEWGFGDEVEPEIVDDNVASESIQVDPPTEDTEDPEDAWDLDDDEPVDVNGDNSSAWDDSWGETETLVTSTSPQIQSPIPVAPPPPTPAMISSIQDKPSPSHPQGYVEKETYLVSGRVQELMWLVQDTLRESNELSSSGILSPYASTSSSPIGTWISQTTASVLDLYRALYPVAAFALLESSPKYSMRFSNDCWWLYQELAHIKAQDTPSGAYDKLKDCQERFKVLADSWFEETVDSQSQKVNDILDSAEGFVGTTDQERFDVCEAAVNQVLQNVRRFAQQVKLVLAKGKYYQAVGGVVNSALSRILDDVLALPDVTAEESHKLSELCHILAASEGLFVEDPAQPSFVVAYVPLWLKFSYLSELLEASIADISYLFEEGALVDFEISELVNLVRALFADTQLRTNTINKLMQGHPVHS
ncbi:hypothetical protein EW026_g6495 [Hermanssonia centrifuga]|uniref:ZW10 C-terminal helical domain-containing protein n=1 Tax=Hermanssonia centrifuga TaxID=98765 RepID=A0A4V3X9Q2_9APHY|nr:hypothetical protein EW026_g6495 [Hermanssonia centrifuga]